MKKRLQELKKEIAWHNYRYYALDSPLIADAQYDALMRELSQIESQHPDWVTADSPTQRVGTKPVSGFATVPHQVPMLSLGNAFDADELFSFDKRVRDALFSDGLFLAGQAVSYNAANKFDGLAVGLRDVQGAVG